MNSYGWRALVCLSSLPLGLFALSSWWLPESARFLITKVRRRPGTADFLPHGVVASAVDVPE